MSWEGEGGEVGAGGGIGEVAFSHVDGGGLGGGEMVEEAAVG